MKVTLIRQLNKIMILTISLSVRIKECYPCIKIV
jgi:hypothetical protein